MKVEIYNETKEDIPYLETIKKVIEKALELEKVEGECNIIFVDDTYIHKLNKEYRKIDRKTDVISFALEDEDRLVLPDGVRILGDIYISLDTAKEQAKEYGHSELREVSFLAVHGLYHLLGYDHRTKEEEEIMFQKQEEVLQIYGITR